MNNKIPTLTFEPFSDDSSIEEGSSTDILSQQDIQIKKEPFDENMLSPEEKKVVEDFASKIDLNKSNEILQYGVGAQKKISDFSETTLNNVRTKDLGEIGEMLSGVVTELRKFDVEEEKKGFLGIFKKSSNKLTTMKAKYDKAEVNVNKICETLEKSQIQLLKDIAMLDKMYELNKTYFKELSMYILAGKKKLAKVHQEELPALIAKSNTSGLPEDAQSVKDLTALCNRFEKKIHDLELTRMISIQMAPQIRLVQGNDSIMAEKIQSTIVNTIPLWKSQMVLALGVTHSSQAAKAQREVTDMTNELLKKNAETLKSATIETAKESERGIVDIETLKATNESLISTLDEVMRIQIEGRQKRKEAEIELNRIEEELKTKLLQIKS
ncbi:toxic anion resistance protein [Tissierella creatinophila]|uniref:TelA-like protein n=1 Tax=Tissierella creatinophila DSM 6911 TaxID=1123403 RepID=A0A1U7M314_TISCR|nr:toxic anion resistance protein [Tissierella creatinophila]OLS01640.1 TelA-like protein [Tissierella creatinophila DSM 6911]